MSDARNKAGWQGHLEPKLFELSGGSTKTEPERSLGEGQDKTKAQTHNRPLPQKTRKGSMTRSPLRESSHCQSRTQNKFCRPRCVLFNWLLLFKMMGCSTITHAEPKTEHPPANSSMKSKSPAPNTRAKPNKDSAKANEKLASLADKVMRPQGSWRSLTGRPTPLGILATKTLFSGGNGCKSLLTGNV